MSIIDGVHPDFVIKVPDFIPRIGEKVVWPHYYPHPVVTHLSVEYTDANTLIHIAIK